MVTLANALVSHEIVVLELAVPRDLAGDPEQLPPVSGHVVGEQLGQQDVTRTWAQGVCQVDQEREGHASSEEGHDLGARV